MNLQHYIRAFRQNWWIIPATICFCLGVGLAFSYSQTPEYQAVGTFLATPGVQIDDTNDLMNGIDSLARYSGLVSTYCEILESQTILQQASDLLGIAVEMAKDYEITCVVRPDASVVELQINGPSPYLAADLANAIGVVGLSYLTSLYQVFELRLLDTASVPAEPISPDHRFNIVASLIIGLISGIGFIVLRQTLIELFVPQSALPTKTQSAHA